MEQIKQFFTNLKDYNKRKGKELRKLSQEWNERFVELYKNVEDYCYSMYLGNYRLCSVGIKYKGYSILFDGIENHIKKLPKVYNKFVKMINKIYEKQRKKYGDLTPKYCSNCGEKQYEV